MLHGTFVAVVAANEAGCERLASPMRAAGATVAPTIVQVNAMATLSVPGFDAIVLDIGTDPERFLSLAASLHDDPRTGRTPLVGLVDGAISATRLAPLALGRLLTSHDEARLPQVLSTIIEMRRSAFEALETARALDERQRDVLDRLVAMRSDAETLTHDARALCGIVLGFAANLRDGVVGSLEEMQQAHVRQIIETTNDLTGLIDRFDGGVRVKIPTEPMPPLHAGRRVARRTLLDLSELALTTSRPFVTMTEQKCSIVIDAPNPVPFWGDGLQIKQVLVNLLVNALKFTPAGGQVTLTVRRIAPAHSAAGAAGRAYAELIVSDTGPGIPSEERERIFDRGVRLQRDEKVPGSGLGLAVVRDILQSHGATIRVEDTQGGGATIVVDLPLDLRVRREPGVLLVDDPEAARQAIVALRDLRNPTVESARSADGTLSNALDGCRAIVVVPKVANGALNDLLASNPTTEVASR
jgi:signal transduction histidine kinase